VRVGASSDHAEEPTSRERSPTSSDLELVNDGSVTQTVGLRFAGHAIPAGATITNAYIQFAADESQSEPTALTSRAQAGTTGYLHDGALQRLLAPAHERLSAMVARGPERGPGLARTSARPPSRR
jgi:hypothetical protein